MITASVLWYLISAIFIQMITAAKSCVDSAPKSWTNEQKQRYCHVTSTSGWKSSIECAHQARSDLKLKFEDVYLLCVDAVSSAPVQCMSSLSKKEREQYGISLCTRAVSDATYKCWSELSQFKGKDKITDTMQILNFCKELDGYGPLQCIQTSHLVLDMNPSLTLAPCSNALMRADADIMSSCLSTLKPYVFASNSNMAARDHGKKGIADVDAIDFCSAASTNEAITCFMNSDDMKISASDRLKLCYGAESNTGPLECFNKLLFDNKKISSSTIHDASNKDGASNSVVKDRITLGIVLCAMASHDEPAVCFNEGLRIAGNGINPTESALNSKSTAVKARHGQGGRSSGSVLQGFSDTDYILLQLCQGSEGTGPIECFRKSQSVFRPADLSADASLSWYNTMYGEMERSSEDAKRSLALEMRVHLCLHATSSAPSECGLRAPQWLAAPERLHLCATATQESLPIKCLQSIEGPAKNFHKAPKKVLGYFLENIAVREAQHARSMAINMCSFSSSSNPLASAQCLVKAPVSLKLVDALSLCTNVSVTSDVDEIVNNSTSSFESLAKEDGISASVYISTCIRLAPRQWSSEELSAVCKGIRSASEAQYAVECVQGVMKSVESMLRIGAHSTQTNEILLSAANTCHAWKVAPQDIALEESPDAATLKGKYKRQQKPEGTRDIGADHYRATLSCVESAISALMREGRAVPVENIYAVCSGAVNSGPGECLSRIASQWRLTFDEGADVRFCSASGAMHRFGCLLKQPAGKAISVSIVKACLSEPVHAFSAKPLKVWSSDPNDGPDIQSGKRFTMDVQLYDQWNQPLVGFDNDIYARASINNDNEQGAVLWGTRSNMTSNGVLYLNTLSISQPGAVYVKITTKTDKDETIVLTIFKLIVKVNPDLQDTLHCTFIFKQALCPSAVSPVTANDWENEFPQESAYFLSQHFMMSSACYKLITEVWGVTLHISAIDGSSIALYRTGVDSIWTGGRGYPHEEMTHESILELNMSLWNDEISALKAKKAKLIRDAERVPNGLAKLTNIKLNKELLPKLQKILKKAYYRKSLQWHPDRWSQYPLYTDAVTRAFELINEANSKLNDDIAELAALPNIDVVDEEKNPMY